MHSDIYVNVILETIRNNTHIKGDHGWECNVIQPSGKGGYLTRIRACSDIWRPEENARMQPLSQSAYRCGANSLQFR